MIARVSMSLACAVLALAVAPRRPRAVARGRRRAGHSLRAVLHGAAAPLDVTVYKPAIATWYGPGFFGKQTACGIALTPDLQGLAHRTLPCGTRVAVAYGGRSVALPVIDRGPFGVPGAEWDLTQAAAMTLGITATTRLGAARLRDQPAASR